MLGRDKSSRRLQNQVCRSSVANKIPCPASHETRVIISTLNLDLSLEWRLGTRDMCVWSASILSRMDVTIASLLFNDPTSNLQRDVRQNQSDHCGGKDMHVAVQCMKTTCRFRASRRTLQGFTGKFPALRNLRFTLIPKRSTRPGKARISVCEQPVRTQVAHRCFANRTGLSEPETWIGVVFKWKRARTVRTRPADSLGRSIAWCA